MHPLLLQILPLNTSTTRLLRHGCLFLTLVLALAAFLPTAQAQLPPAPDGGYPSDNTAEGDGALFSLTSGANNTAIGSGALFSNTTGNSNTASGNLALTSNTTGAANTA